jgi:hypothetical protein
MVEQTTHMDIGGDDIGDDDNEDTNDVAVEEDIYTYKPYKDEGADVPAEELLFFGNTIRDIKSKQVESRSNIITEEGIIMDFPKKHCHCGKKKLYKACCSQRDFIGEFGKDKVFYCDLEAFKRRFHCEVVDKNPKEEKKENNVEVNNLSKHMEKIFI